MNNTWIKLYRQLLDHDILRDHTALAIFLWILLAADYKKGETISGRFWAAKHLGMNPNTFYKGLKRIEKKYDLVTLSGNNRNTVISIKNWDKYQGSGNTSGNTWVTPGQHLGNTNQEVKKLRNTTQRKKYPRESIQEEEVQRWVAKKYAISLKDVAKTVGQLENWLDAKGKIYKDYRAGLCSWVDKRITAGEIKPVSAQMKQYYEQTGRWG